MSSNHIDKLMQNFASRRRFNGTNSSIKLITLEVEEKREEFIYNIDMLYLSTRLTPGKI